MYIGRREDKSIYGLWTVRQWEGQEELPDNDPQVLAMMAPPVNAAIDAQIRSIEQRELAPRYSREAILVGILKDHMRDFSLTAAAALAELTTVGGPHYNAGFTKLKALDDQIKALRAQRQP